MIDHTLIISLSLVGLVLTLFITPFIIRYMKSIGKVGNDVHKVDRPEVAESGGIGFMSIFLLIIVIGIFSVNSQNLKNKLIITLVILTIVTTIGIVDDFRGLSAKLKPLLLVFAALPVVIFRELGGELSLYPDLYFRLLDKHS